MIAAQAVVLPWVPRRTVQAQVPSGDDAPGALVAVGERLGESPSGRAVEHDSSGRGGAAPVELVLARESTQRADA